MINFDPVIIAFCCEYCAYTAADMAGSNRINYPSNIKIIKIPCSGTISSLHILEAFKNGADGVFIAGCLNGDCHFKNGNIRAMAKVKTLKNLLNDIGIENERLEMFNISAGMGSTFAKIANDFTNKIKKIGLNPINKTINL